SLLRYTMRGAFVVSCWHGTPGKKRIPPAAASPAAAAAPPPRPSRAAPVRRAAGVCGMVRRARLSRHTRPALHAHGLVPLLACGMAPVRARARRAAAAGGAGRARAVQAPAAIPLPLAPVVAGHRRGRAAEPVLPDVGAAVFP